MTALSLSKTVHADSIPYNHADEAHRLLSTALSRFMTLVESIHADDWSKPTACTAWNLHDMVAHQAGGYASGTSYKEMIRQYTSKPKPGQLPEDAINDLQVGERADKTPAELIAELKQVGEIAAHKWAYGFNAIKWVATPHPVGGFMSIRHLMWIIPSRHWFRRHPRSRHFWLLHSPLFARLVSNEQQAQSLATIRDTLLPRLISGQLRLPEALVEIEEAA